MSRRKSPALVGIVEEERVLGEEASSLGIRYPNLIFSQLRNLLGRSAGDAEVQRLVQQNLLPYTVVDHPERGTAALQVNETTSYLVEELVAGIFQYAKQITDAQAGESVVDTVVVVPAWFGVAQRQAVIDAASLAGLNVLGLVNGHAAAALQFGIERDFAKKEQTVILYDIGSGSTEAALVKYSVYGKPGSSKGVTNQFEVLDVEWDHSLGSNSLDLLLAEHFAKEFMDKGCGDVRKSPKAMAKLRKQVRRTKEVLSANSAAPISVEELHEGKDFQSSIKREEFEAMAGDYWKRVAAPLTKLLARNKLAAKDVDAVELLGGGSRVPKLQAELSAALGGRHLDRHLDADEALVLGAGLFAANLSSSFRLRKFGMTDIAAFGVSFESRDLHLPAAAAAPAKDAAASSKASKKSKAKGKKGAAAVEEEAVEPLASSKSGHVLKNLLPAGKKLPIKRAIKYTNLTIDGFSFELRYNASTVHGLPPGVESPELAKYTVAGIQDAIKRYNQSGVTTLRFEADYSSLLHFSSAECVVELEVIEDKVIEVPVPANKTERAAANATDDAAGDKDKDAASKDAGADSKGDKDAGKDETAKADDEQQAEKKEGDAAAGGDAANATEAAAPANKTVLIKKTIQVPRRKVFHVTLNVTGDGPRHALLSGEPLKQAQAHLAAWVAAETVKAATAKAKNDLEAYIIATREKLETQEALQQVTTEEARVKFIEQLTEAEDWLYGDGEAEAADAFTTRLAGLKAVGEPIARRAAELELRPQVLSAVKEQSEAAEKLIASWADTKPWINENDTKAAADKLEEFTQWLQQQVEAQDKKEPTEEPAFIAMDVVTKWEGVQKALRKTDSKRKPKPPKPAANETASANETAAAEGAAEGTAEGAEGAGADAGGEAGAGAEESAGEQEGGDSSSSSTAAEDEELPAHEEL
ncbi:hypothetical protein OEZ85_014432 [Tetradesmus obliquus]|uniref:Uncharacterized protein n=1 Tax=Tetradesmus obliquus TaxID=3088 RepID=A0ABY8U8M8_TETOB|nr:hypothetical protein OEZ85_014432 [Tetradesmus obliquus]